MAFRLAPGTEINCACTRGRSDLSVAPSAARSKAAEEFLNWTMTSTGVCGSMLLRSGAILLAIWVCGSTVPTDGALDTVSRRRPDSGLKPASGTFEIGAMALAEEP